MWLFGEQGHNGDVAALSLKPGDSNIFVTGSVDRTARIWDLRRPGMSYIRHRPPGIRVIFGIVVQVRVIIGIVLQVYELYSALSSRYTSYIRHSRRPGILSENGIKILTKIGLLRKLHQYTYCK